MNSDMDGETLGGFIYSTQHIYRFLFEMLLLDIIKLKLTADE